MQQPHNVLNQLVQIDPAEFRRLAGAERQQTLNNIGTAPALLVDDVQILPVILGHCFILPQLLQLGQTSLEPLGKTLDGRQGIIDFVGHTGRQQPNGGHFFSMIKFFLILFFQCNVALYKNDVPWLTLRIAQRRCRNLEMPVTAVDGYDGVLAADAVELQGLAQGASRAGFIALPEDFVAKGVHWFGGVVNGIKTVVDGADAMVGCHHGHYVGDPVQDSLDLAPFAFQFKIGFLQLTDFDLNFFEKAKFGVPHTDEIFDFGFHGSYQEASHM